MTDQFKLEIVQRALAAGILNDPRLVEQPDEPLPAWVVLEIILKAIDKLDPPGFSFD